MSIDPGFSSSTDYAVSEQMCKNKISDSLYWMSRRIYQSFNHSLTWMLPGLQVLMHKEPADSSFTLAQRVKKIGTACAAAPLVLLTVPLAGIAKLMQWIIRPYVNPYQLHISKAAQRVLFSQENIVNSCELKLATCNVIGLINPALILGDKPSDETADQRLPKIAQVLNDSDLDIICMQESFEEVGTDRMAEEFGKKYPYVLNHCGDESPFSLNSGLSIASKFPIEAAHFVPYSNTLGIDRYAKKGVLFAKLILGEQNGKKIIGYIATTHLQANTPNREKSSEARAEQLELIQKEFDQFISHTFKSDETIKLKALCGDLNFDNYHSHRKYLDRNELRHDSISRLFRETIDPFVDLTGEKKADDWVRPLDPPGTGTATYWRRKSWSERNPEELFKEIEGQVNEDEVLEKLEQTLTKEKAKEALQQAQVALPSNASRLDYILFFREEHAANQEIEIKNQIVHQNGRVLTDHLMMESTITYQALESPSTLTHCRYTLPFKVEEASLVEQIVQEIAQKNPTIKK